MLIILHEGCTMGRRLTEIEYIEKATALHNGRYAYININYNNYDSILTVICKEHGEFIIAARNHLKGKGGCIKCSGGVALTTEQYVTKCIEVHIGKYDYSDVVYTNHNSLIKIKCPTHGYFHQVADYHKSGNGCPKCIGRVEHSRTIFLNNLPEKHKKNKNYDYSKIPLIFKPSTLLTIICKEHGEFITTYERFVNRIHGCRGCSGYAKSNTSEFITKAVSVHKSKYTYNNVNYISWETDINVTCTEHGDFEIRPNNHLNGKGCPKCTHQISSQENKILTQFPIFKQTVRDIIAPYHLDLYSPENNLAIEVNGRYWHSEDKGKPREYHLFKTDECLSKGITLLHFWDDEINVKFEIIKSMINSRLGTIDRVYARKTKVIIPIKSEVKLFLEANHLQGSANYSAAYGLEYNNELIAVMTFGKPRFNKGYEWEIIRLASKLNLSIVGGASKLFKAFVKDKLPNSVITYADRRYSEGNVYEQLGFLFSHNSKPNYFYAKGAYSILRYSAQKHKLPKLLGDKFDANKSEGSNMLDAGYVRVYDCGNKVFTWNPQKCQPLTIHATTATTPKKP